MKPVDLTALLPVLTPALKPFRDGIRRIDKMPKTAKPSDATLLSAYAPIGQQSVGDMRKLVDAVEAIYRMAGVEL